MSKYSLTIFFIGVILLGSFYYYANYIRKNLSWKDAHSFILKNCSIISIDTAIGPYLGKTIPVSYNLKLTSKYPFISKVGKSLLSVDPIDQNGIFTPEGGHQIPDMCWVVWSGNKYGGLSRQTNEQKFSQSS